MKKLSVRSVVMAGLVILIALIVFFTGGYIVDEQFHIMDGETTAPSTAAPTTAAPTAPPTTVLPTGSVSDYNILDDKNIQLLPTPITISINEDLWYLTLVNNQYRMPENYPVTGAYCAPNSDVELDYRVAVEYRKMYDAAAAQGLYLTPYSGLRAYATQKRNYANKTSLYLNQGYSQAEAEALAAMIIMPPGSSEHNLGLAMDIIATDDNFYQTPEYAWLEQNAADFGFILRYPKDKQHITRVEYEPWHWRYVGVEHAHAIKASGLCLEEYLQAIGMMPQAAVPTSAVLSGSAVPTSAALSGSAVG